MRYLHVGFAYAFFALSLVMPGSTATEVPLREKPVVREPTTDHEFLIQVLGWETAEVKFAERALEKSSQEGVRKLARRIRDAHVRLRDALLKTAKANKITLTAQMTKEQEDALVRLSKLRGAELDRAYVRHVVNAQEKEGTLYTKWARDARNEALRKISRQALASIKELRPEAERLQKALAY